MLQTLARLLSPSRAPGLQRLTPIVTTVRDFHSIFTSKLNITYPSFIRTTSVPLKHSLLKPGTSLVEQVAGFKVKGRLRRRCKDCYFVIRQERLHVICKTHPRHKQMAMKQRDYKTWILTHATQSKIRPY